MKKFGKIFGITTLAFATLTAGVIGLSGCGEKWKNPDNTPEPEKPPIIVTPPTEEIPLVGMVTLDEIDAYLKRPDVKITFDAFKVTSDANSFDFSEDIKGMEFSASVDAEKKSKNMAMKFTYKDDHTETNYVTSTEPSLFVLTEKAGENPIKRKYVEGEEFDSMVEGMGKIYENSHDITPSFEDIKTISTSPETLEFYYSAVRKSLNENISYEINFEYNAWEDIPSTDGIVRVKTYYEMGIIYNFSNNEIQSVTSSCTITEKGSSESTTSVVKIEEIESLNMPTDFDQYVLEEELTLEQVGQYLSDSSVVSTFDGVDVRVKDNINNKTKELSALKDGETFKSSSKNFFEVDDKIYYVLSDNRVYVVDGETTTQITDAEKVPQILNQNAEKCAYYSDIKIVFDEFSKKYDSILEKELTIKKFTVGNEVQIVVEFSYNNYISIAEGEDKVLVNYKEILIFNFVDAKIQNFSHSLITTKIDGEEVIESVLEEVSIIDTLDFPEFPAEPEGGEESGSEGGNEGGTEGGNEGGEVVGGEEQQPEVA